MKFVRIKKFGRKGREVEWMSKLKEEFRFLIFNGFNILVMFYFFFRFYSIGVIRRVVDFGR